MKQAEKTKLEEISQNLLNEYNQSGNKSNLITIAGNGTFYQNNSPVSNYQVIIELTEQRNLLLKTLQEINKILYPPKR